MSAIAEVKRALVALEEGRDAAAENLLHYAIAAIRIERNDWVAALASDLARASGTALAAGESRLSMHLLRLSGRYGASGGRYATETAWGTRTGD